jgi:UDP-2,3-diacylglucosamine pyrophosphatase LpxH
MSKKNIYVISDLHLGGETKSGSRGFRICTHEDKLAEFISHLGGQDCATELVINGDMVDFLAERDISPPPLWKPFHQEDHAVQLLDRIANRSVLVFAASFRSAWLPVSIMRARMERNRETESGGLARSSDEIPSRTTK